MLYKCCDYSSKQDGKKSLPSCVLAVSWGDRKSIIDIIKRVIGPMKKSKEGWNDVCV